MQELKDYKYPKKNNGQDSNGGHMPNHAKAQE
jgi:hypothetical protein